MNGGTVGLGRWSCRWGVVCSDMGVPVPVLRRQIRGRWPDIACELTPPRSGVPSPGGQSRSPDSDRYPTLPSPPRALWSVCLVLGGTTHLPEGNPLGYTRYMQLTRRLGATIKRLRQERGWTQQQLADRVGIARVSVARIETGARAVSVATLERIAKALRVAPGRLLN
jgi:DNA-binding Xre family transcriptional regulator